MSHIAGAIQLDPESEQSLEDLGIAGDSTGERYIADNIMISGACLTLSQHQMYVPIAIHSSSIGMSLQHSSAIMKLSSLNRST